MRKTALFICILSFLYLPNMVLAANCSGTTADTCGAGCVWSDDSCSTCPANSYCPNNQTKTQCPQSHPNSAPGSTKDTNCYKNCLDKTIDHGKWAPDNATAYYNQDCLYTKPNNITCDNTSSPCDGYHPEGDKCVSNKKNCSITNSTNGFQIWTNNNWSECYATQCQSGYAIDSIITQCSQTVGTKCTSTQCSSELNATGQCAGGTVSGQWTWNSGYTNKNYNNCKCTKIETTNGNITINCSYQNDTGNSTKWDCTTTVNSCNAGYCETDSNKKQCSQTPAGYYSGQTEKTCHPCPMGSTSSAGASAKTDCYITGGTDGTEFCDNNGCFTLPAGTKLNAN